ncbi:unnamed protein product [Prunus armeniaca]
MDKSGVKLDKAGEEYKTCLQQFIDDSLLVASHDGMLKCPCKKCYNRFWRETNLVWAHLLYEGMDPHYEDQVWVFHGEHLPDPDFMEEVEEQELCEPTVNEIHNVLYDVFGSDSSANDGHVDTEGQTTNVRAEYAEKFYDLLNDANTHLYAGSTKMKKLEFLVKLYQAKCLSGSTDKGMDIMLKLVKIILPDGETLPNSFYDVKQLIEDLGLTYQKIDACPNDCMLYWKESILDDSCNHCGQNRYQKQDVEENGDTRKVPAKVLRYFPLTPRLQRLYLSRGHVDPGMMENTISVEERWNYTDDRVSKEQLRLLVQYWETSPALKRSITNKCNHAKRRMHHTTGTKSYAQVRNQYKVNHRGVSPDRCKIFELCHLRKNGTLVNKTAAKAVRHPCNKMHS